MTPEEGEVADCRSLRLGSRRSAFQPRGWRLSTASVYPESSASAFESAAALGYDAIEVMVGIDPVSQDVERGQASSSTDTRSRSAPFMRPAC